MKKLTLASAILAAFAGSVAHAEEAAPAPDHVVSFNVGATSDYRFRGISQSRGDPAVFAGVDYTHTPSGLYVGAWTSTIKWVKDAGASSGSYELDIYGGKRGQLGEVAYDVGLISYNYPGNTLKAVTGANANTVEAFAQVGYSFATLKYSYALTNFIGNSVATIVISAWEGELDRDRHRGQEAQERAQSRLGPAGEQRDQHGHSHHQHGGRADGRRRGGQRRGRRDLRCGDPVRHRQRRHDRKRPVLRERHGHRHPPHDGTLYAELHLQK